MLLKAVFFLKFHMKDASVLMWWFLTSIKEHDDIALFSYYTEWPRHTNCRPSLYLLGCYSVFWSYSTSSWLNQGLIMPETVINVKSVIVVY